MLIEKVYNFEISKKELEFYGIGNLKDFYYISINKIIQELYLETKEYETLFVYLGPYIFTLLKDAYNINTPGVNFEYIDFRNFINIVREKPKNSTHIGHFVNRDVYYNSSLKNKIVISTKLSEVEQFIKKNQRKEKLKKLK